MLDGATPCAAPAAASAAGRGYRGRLGVFEVLVVDQALRRVLVGDPSEQAITAATAGMPSLRDAAVAKALAGETTFDEVLRVSPRDDDAGRARRQRVVVQDPRQQRRPAGRLVLVEPSHAYAATPRRCTGLASRSRSRPAAVITVNSPRASLSQASRRTSPSRSSRSTSRVRPLRESSTRSASSDIRSRRCGASTSCTRTS